ncbi:hypothetical protein ACQP25_44875 (plasmid) [Microtetraspora malaysiensis]|uniref:hypothetical protein n=1 Tax=Microtetraspora malaysiensis TaxID=161358 RepID=UPI003D8E55AE
MIDDFDEPGTPPGRAIPARVLRDVAGIALMVIGALAMCVSVGALWVPAAGWCLAGVFLAVGGYFVASGE